LVRGDIRPRTGSISRERVVGKPNGNEDATTGSLGSPRRNQRRGRKPVKPRFDSPIIGAVLVLALTVFVAAASRDGPFWSLLRSTQGDPRHILLEVAPMILGGALLLVVVALFRSERSEGGAPTPLRQVLTRMLPIAAVGVTLVSLFLISRTEFPPASETIPGAQALAPSSDRRPTLSSMRDWFDMGVRADASRGDEERRGEPGSGIGERYPFPKVVIGILVVLLAGAIIRRWLRPRWAVSNLSDPTIEDRRTDTARAALDETIRAMLGDPDPKTAIRGAYARLLMGLEIHGGGRLDHEGPMEHLTRVLNTLRVPPAPLRDLIHLFELARFSPRVLTVAHRDRAIEALRLLAEALGNGQTAGSVPTEAQRWHDR
jgi:hypothetical protein